jgi:hypothetical protein
MQYDLVESVALSQENQDWVREEIRRAINPNGWRKLAYWLREWSLVAVVPTIMIALLALVFTAGYYAFSRVGQEATFQTRTTDKLSAIDDNLKSLNIAVADIRLKQASSSPTASQSIKDAQNILHTAQSNKVAIPSDAIADAGTKFVSATKTNPDAWNAVLELLSYRTYVNSLTVPLGPQEPISKALITQYQFNPETFPNGAFGTMRTIGSSKAPDVPQFRSLSVPDLNEKLGVGPSFLVLDSATLVLDAMYIKKVIFVNSHIIYRGGPVVLENAYFLNCTFEIDRQSNGQQLANRIMSGPSTTFMAS